MNLRDIRHREDEEAARQFCLARYGVDPAAYGARIFCGQVALPKLTSGFEEDHAVWFKRRLEQLNVPLPGLRHDPPDEGELTYNPLHVFFIGLEETEEMLQRVRFDAHIRLFRYLVARSGMYKAILHIQPIDAVAARVLCCDPGVLDAIG